MKSNFTNEEIGKVVISLTSAIKVNVRVNRCGNIVVTHPKTYNTEKWTIYHNNFGFLWRRCDLISGYTYPLHMVNRNDIETLTYNYTDGTSCTYQSWDTHKHCNFKTIDEAIAYFITYFKNRTKKYANLYNDNDDNYKFVTNEKESNFDLKVKYDNIFDKILFTTEFKNAMIERFGICPNGTTFDTCYNDEDSEIYFNLVSKSYGYEYSGERVIGDYTLNNFEFSDEMLDFVMDYVYLTMIKNDPIMLDEISNYKFSNF